MQKQSLHQHCLEQLEDKINTLKQAIEDAQDAASDDTKSSAGDKFETSREMMRAEIDKNNQQLALVRKMLRGLEQIKPNQPKDRVSFGSLVMTNEGNYYFSVGMGKVVVDGQPYFALSMASPIGQALSGRQAGETVPFMKRDIQIEAIY